VLAGYMAQPRPQPLVLGEHGLICGTSGLECGHLFHPCSGNCAQQDAEHHSQHDSKTPSDEHAGLEMHFVVVR
jgi:hypothetical protein